MSRLLPVALSLLVIGGPSRAMAQPYPLVYGSTGRPYGPTQAEYQYQRQYGRPWHGYGGATVSRPSSSFGGTYVAPGLFGYSSYYGCHHAAPWGPPVYVNSPFPYGYSAPGPFVFGLDRVTYPGHFTTNPAPLSPNLPLNPIVPLAGGDLDDAFAGIGVPAEGKIDPAKRPVAPSSPAARLRSLEKQAVGDTKLRKHQWAQAYLDYRSAVDSAPDRAEGHFRLGFLFTAMQHYSSAVREFKRGLFLDPTLPQTGEKLPILFGPDSQIVRTSIVLKVADWLREDIRDPDRLFLLGLLLHYEDDSRSREVLEAAGRMAAPDQKDHILAFLTLPADVPANGDQNPKPNPVLRELPKLQPNPVAPGADGPAPLNDNRVPPAPLPQAPLPEPDSEVPPLSNQAVPPANGPTLNAPGS